MIHLFGDDENTIPMIIVACCLQKKWWMTFWYEQLMNVIVVFIELKRSIKFGEQLNIGTVSAAVCLIDCGYIPSDPNRSRFKQAHPEFSSLGGTYESAFMDFLAETKLR